MNSNVVLLDIAKFTSRMGPPVFTSISSVWVHLFPSLSKRMLSCFLISTNAIVEKQCVIVVLSCIPLSECFFTGWRVLFFLFFFLLNFLFIISPIFLWSFRPLNQWVYSTGTLSSPTFGLHYFYFVVTYREKSSLIRNSPCSCMFKAFTVDLVLKAQRCWI